jgi:hypothetical protein
MFQDRDQRRFPFFKDVNAILPADSAFLIPSPDCFNDDGPNDADRTTYKNALQPFSHYALSSLQPGGGKLCQEAPRLVPIISKKKAFFNVNFLDFLADQGAIA